MAATRSAQWPTSPPTLMPLSMRSTPAEVVAVGGPVPGQAFEDGPARDVLDALHHLGEELALAGPDRGEGDPAVAEHGAGDAVPARRGGQRIPGELGVEVGVHVDEPGGDDPAGRRRFPGCPCRRSGPRRQRCGRLRWRRRPGGPAAPVPSTTLPLRMTRSACVLEPMALSPKTRRCRQVCQVRHRRGRSSRLARSRRNDAAPMRFACLSVGVNLGPICRSLAQ